MRSLLQKLIRYPKRGPAPEPAYGDFVARATGVGADHPATREQLARSFAAIHKHVACAHQEAEALLLAEAILTTKAAGPIIELGCFKGGCTCKLSLVARATGRRLYVCDSFAGLPRPGQDDAHHELTSGRVKMYQQGDYCGPRAEVEANLRAHGAPEVCEIVEGFFEQTLPALDIQPCLAFMDVDLIESARTCLRNLWPRLQAGARFYTHEATAMTFLRGLLDPTWWTQTLRQHPPILLGAGFGFGPHAKNLAYFDRGEAA